MSLEEFLHGWRRKIRHIPLLPVLSLSRWTWYLNRLALPPVKVALTVLFWGCCAVLSHSVLANSLQPHELQPARLLSPRGFSRHEYWCGFPCSLPGDLPDPGIEPRSPTLQADSLVSPMIFLSQSLFNLSPLILLLHGPVPNNCFLISHCVLGTSLTTSCLRLNFMACLVSLSKAKPIPINSSFWQPQITSGYWSKPFSISPVSLLVPVLAGEIHSSSIWFQTTLQVRSLTPKPLLLQKTQCPWACFPFYSVQFTYPPKMLPSLCPLKRNSS